MAKNEGNRVKRLATTTRPPQDRPSPGPPNISLFFAPLPPQFSFFLPSLGGLVEFWWCFRSAGASKCERLGSRAVVSSATINDQLLQILLISRKKASNTTEISREDASLHLQDPNLLALTFSGLLFVLFVLLLILLLVAAFLVGCVPVAACCCRCCCLCLFLLFVQLLLFFFLLLLLLLFVAACGPTVEPPTPTFAVFDLPKCQ